jgi:putative metallohydrolase (TIGR04338 family)
MTLLAASGVSFNCSRDCEDARAYVEQATATQWFKRRFGGVTIEVKRGHHRLRYPAASIGGPIELPRGVVSEMQLVHELAHCVQPPNTAGHGSEFVRIFFDLVERLMGAHYAAELQAIADEDGILVAPPTSDNKP